MENKKIAAAILCLLSVLPLAAQSKDGRSALEDKKHYFIREEETGEVLYQRLSWEEIDDIFGFEFILEQKDDAGVWNEIDKKIVHDNFIDVSLVPGSYRYKVTVINLLEQREASSAYRNFDILIAYQPGIEAVTPHLIYLDEFFDGRFTAVGVNFLEDTVFFFKKTGGGTIELKPEEISKDGKRVRFELNTNRFQPGAYVFIARDRSGLTGKSEDVTFRFQKPVDAYVSLGYAFTSFTGESVFKEFYNRTAAPLGGVFRLTVLPIKRTYGNFGFNLNYSAAMLKNEHDGYVLDGTLMLSHLNAAYVYPIVKHRLNLGLYAGGGAVFLMKSKFSFDGGNAQSPEYWYWGFDVDAGTALQAFVHKKMYLELNVDHFFVFREGFPKYMFQPQLSVGWMF
ncbi:hypothetical protein HRQ91_07845 [Treponema parvum]|uniref:Outer membrane protein beta-barrel domain-containing protein n=1 Tax=Treponema parvum TaxID=138851 RepID=A0A975IES7_9SPIR|nr:hypothetical protein [Treponema parvum]QTQ14370.1 hypothetical protein HRQ91_07845 [Treponema parvum]